MLAKGTLKAIQIETTTVWIDDVLRQSGFATAYYDPFRRVLSCNPTDNPANHLFVRDFAFVAGRLANARKIKVLGREI
jgi:hypothetical protein